MPFDHLGPEGKVVEQSATGAWKKVETDLGTTTITGTPEYVASTTVYQNGVTVSPDPETGKLVSNEDYLEEMGYFK